MIDLVELNAGLYNFERVDHEGNTMHEVGLGGKLPVVAHSDELIKPLFVSTRDDVPYFSGSFVVIVDAADVEVLHVPAK